MEKNRLKALILFRPMSPSFFFPMVFCFHKSVAMEHWPETSSVSLQFLTGKLIIK